MFWLYWGSKKPLFTSPCPSSCLKIRKSDYSVGSPGGMTKSIGRRKKGLEQVSSFWAGHRPADPPGPGMVSSADRKGLVFPLRAMLGLAFHSFPTPRRRSCLHPFLNFPWLLPPIICKTRQASRSLFPAALPPPSFAYRQNASSSFSPSAPSPRPPDFHSDHLFRVALGRLADRPKGLPSAKCTAMASPIWTPASYLHYSLLPPTSSTLRSSQPPPVNAPWLPVVLIPWWSLCTLILWDSAPIRSALLRWGVSHCCAVR